MKRFHCKIDARDYIEAGHFDHRFSIRQVTGSGLGDLGVHLTANSARALRDLLNAFLKTHKAIGVRLKETSKKAARR